jgi:hypothetical protein
VNQRKTPTKHSIAAIHPDDVEVPPLPSSKLKLTPEEIALLPDPRWVTEDDADAIVCRRQEAEGKYSPVDDVLRRLGHQRKVGA